MSMRPEPTLKELQRYERAQRARIHNGQAGADRPARHPKRRVSFGIGQFAVGTVVWTIVFPLPAVIFIIDDRIEYDGGLSVIGIPLFLLVLFGPPLAVAILVGGLLLRRIRNQGIHIAVIAGTAAATAALILWLLPHDTAHQPGYWWTALTAGAAAACGRLAVCGFTRITDPPPSGVGAQNDAEDRARLG
ncbi:hypothetical protein [Arthrobacter sp. 35W]|uniref:hypothetical protein n=1 Tax=Arthrobacter sp. 35W TaxID=1132441 RepID=UPI00041C00D6|nr:hypothetical protein [Arthrobacter sp. 35W]